MHAVGLGKLVRAMPRVSVEPVMVVLSGQRSGTLSVASEAWPGICFGLGVGLHMLNL